MCVVRPHPLEEHLPGEDDAGVRREQVQDIEFVGRQLDGLTVENGLASRSVEAERTGLDNA